MSSKGKRKIKIVEVAGNSYEMGFQYGTTCPKIHKMFDINSKVFGGRDAVRTFAEKSNPRGHILIASKMCYG